MPVAVVTGSSSGIGRATALGLATAGFELVLHAHRNLRGLQETAAHIRQLLSPQPAALLCLTADIADARACHDLVATAFAWRPQIDAWVNNAGADVLTGAARHWSFEERLQLLLQVDLMGTVRLSRLAAQRMSQRAHAVPAATAADQLPPTIINISWDQAPLGMEGEPGQLFGTTKSAIAAFSHSLALSLSGVRVNCVAPGWIQTSWGQDTASDYWSQRAIQESLLGRWGTPEDVAQAILWLASPASQFINGQTLAVNGGRRYFPQPHFPQPPG
ncbi:MAG: SDR family oxidoreductase [Planctomycetales bacterium]|nr:SDR family oxidoreductase [Planctomycetales bacterium]